MLRRLGGFAYYNEEGLLLRINALSAGRADLEVTESFWWLLCVSHQCADHDMCPSDAHLQAIPLQLQGPFEASQAAAKALWDQGRWHKTTLPALLLESVRALLSPRHHPSPPWLPWVAGTFLRVGGDKRKGQYKYTLRFTRCAWPV